MQRLPVSSSDLQSVGYDLTTSILEIEFHAGGVYQYYDVPQNIYNGLMNALSHGEYFSEHIKNVYRYKKIR